MSKSTAPAFDTFGMEEAHRRALLDFTISHSATVIYIADLDGDRPTRFISDNVQWMTGHAAASFVNHLGYGRELIHPEDRDAYMNAIDRVREEKALTIEYRFAHGDGHWLWLRDSLRIIDPAAGKPPTAFVGSMMDITAEREAVARVTTAESMTTALLRNSVDAIVATDEDGVVVEFSPSAETLFGYRRSDVLGRQLHELLVPEHLRARHLEGMERFRAGGRLNDTNRRLQVEALRSDGRTVPVELTVAHAEVDSRRLVIAEIRDITDRLAAERERQRLTRLIRDAIESLPEGFVISDSDGKILFCNRAFSAPYDSGPEEMVGRDRNENIHRFFPNVRSFDGRMVEGDLSHVDWIVERLGDLSGEPIELELVGGGWREITCHPTSDGGSVTLRADITARKQTELALRQSEALVRLILETCPVPVGMTRAEDGTILYESPASRQLFKRDPSDGTVSARSFFVNPEDRDQYLALLRREGRVDGFETFLKRTDGAEFCASISARLVAYQGESVIVSSTYDMTERRQIEAEMARQREALHQSEKLSALGELLAGVSHELNNPLSVVVGQALLLRETASDPRITERARKIGEAADRCARIVRTFLSMARQQPTESRPVNLNAIIENAMEVTGYMLRSAEVDVSLELAPRLPPILADADQLNQVLTNLIVNAQHALEDAPRPHRLRLITSHNRRTDQVTLTVSDNGAGIPEQVRSRIFEPFFTTKEVGTGTGLGLAITHRNVEAHGGTIKIEETPGGGATFVLRFPAHAALHRASEEESAAAAGDRLAILVVDDDPEVSDIIRDVLLESGHRVDLAGSGRAALERLAFRRYDVVLSDIRMPDLDGPAFFDFLCDQHPHLRERIAFCTGDTLSPAIRSFLEESKRPHLEKPLAPADLRALVARLGQAGAKPSEADRT